MERISRIDWNQGIPPNDAVCTASNIALNKIHNLSSESK